MRKGIATREIDGGSQWSNVIPLRKTEGVSFKTSWYLDSETDGLGAPGGRPEVFLCVIFHHMLGYKSFWGNDAIINALVYIAEAGGGDVYAHFGGRFDFRLAYKWLIEHGARGTLVFSGATVLVSDFILPLEEKEVRLTLCDTCRLLPGKLAKIGESLGYPKLDWNHKTTRRVIRTEKGRQRFLAYCKRDVEILVKALERFESIVLPLGIQPRRTLAATCTSVARHRLKNAPKVSEALEEHSLQCVYGGRTEVHRYDSLEQGFNYDIHSSYPFAASQNPVPWNFSHTTRHPRLDQAGYIHCRVSVPEGTDIPLLPAKFDSQPGRVFFPTGEFDGTWTIEELSAAIKRGLATLVKVHQAYIFDTSSFLQEFAFWAWEQRAASKSEFERYFWKIWANSFVGKLIEKSDKVKASFGAPKDLLFSSEIRIGGQSVFLTPTRYLPPFRHAVAGGTILARARVNLWDFLKIAGRVWYMDTDSIHTNNPNLPTGDGLGQLGIERIRNATYLAPKFYTYEALIKGKWKRIVKSKGMPGDFASFEALRQGKSVETHRTRGFRENLRRQSVDYEAALVNKRLRNDTVPKRRILKDGTTVPWTARELIGSA